MKKLKLKLPEQPIIVKELTTNYCNNVKEPEPEGPNGYWSCTSTGWQWVPGT